MSGHPLPNSFEDALKMAGAILGTSPTLIERGTIETEAEQLVKGAFRQAQGRGTWSVCSAMWPSGGHDREARGFMPTPPVHASPRPARPAG